MPAEVVHRDARLRLAIDTELCVARWLDTPEPHHFDRLLAAAQRAAGRGKAAILNVVDAAGKIPRFGEDERAAAKRMSEGLRPLAHAFSHVILMDGFAGATVRMFVSTLTLLGGSKAPTKVFAQLDEGVRWLATQPPNLPAARLQAVYDRLR